MKKSNLLFSAVMALAMGSLASCASDDLVTDIQGQEIVDHDQERYLNVSIVSPGAGTRAITGDFETGIGDENKVSKMTFVFYDAAGKPTGQVHRMGGADFTPDNRPSVNSIHTSTIPVELSQGDNLPAYVICFINAIDDSDLAVKSLDEIEEVKRRSVRTTEGYFPMSNSVYYGTNTITNEANARMVATPIKTEWLYKSEEEAKANDAKTIDIYVERYAARINLTLAPNAIQSNDDVNGYELTFVPEAWRPNAIDQELYAVKRYGIIEDRVGTLNYRPGYSAIANNFGGGDSWWNDPENRRSYWGCSPSYFDAKYPKVSDDITDEVADNAHTADYPFDLHYFNYDQIIKGNNGNDEIKLQPSIKWNATTGFNETFYARETTTFYWAWQNAADYNPMATIASAVIVGRYQVTSTNGGTALPAETTFYLYGKTGEKWNLYLDEANGDTPSIKEVMVNHQSTVLEKDGDAYIPVKEVDIFTVAHPTKAVRDVKGQSIAGRLVALQLANVPNGCYFYNTTTNAYEPIDANNINLVNSNLLTAGYARKYDGGRCYFNIPIEHLGIYGTSAQGATGTYVEGAKNADGTYNFDKCPAGSFGIVRNHAYNINITGISGLATALSSETQPIVPPMDEVSYYISARLNILNWRIVPTQDVEL
ncbi:fimbria major subunit [uncultured Bacteroides sp.]|uniref:fimbria major subunit n=2 Tax=uncultured Bacteroides sp. TaxID=162156 RepID=UPI0025E0B4D2|nr:fimbria major subunit [uncultured Bacteroides sp.]